jgi:hypothetical protein
MLKRMFEIKAVEVAGIWKYLHNKVPHNVLEGAGIVHNIFAGVDEGIILRF